MSFFDNPGRSLRQMEDELLEDEDQAAWEEWEEDQEEAGGDSGDDFPILTRRGSPPVNYAVDFDRTVYDDEASDNAYYAEDYRADRKAARKNRKKGVGGLILLALAELAGIAGVIWWWIQWLK